MGPKLSVSMRVAGRREGRVVLAMSTSILPHETPCGLFVMLIYISSLAAREVTGPT